MADDNPSQDHENRQPTKAQQRAQTPKPYPSEDQLTAEDFSRPLGLGKTAAEIAKLEGLPAAGGFTKTAAELAKLRAMPIASQIAQLGKPYPTIGSKIADSVRNLPASMALLTTIKPPPDFAGIRKDLQTVVDQSQATRRLLDAKLATTQPIRVPRIPAADARTVRELQGVREVLRASAEQVQQTAQLTTTLVTITEESHRTGAQSQRTLNRLTIALVALTALLAVPVFADLWRDWIVPAAEGIPSLIGLR